MNYKAILLAGAFTAFISSQTLPVVQIWVPVTLIVMALLFVAQKVTA
ncbi:MAG: hypothetical protein IKF05_00370 [Erysipelotrichaceae bacterium]|nr:hypothetical protein [Erysipelotrichaceae bacterium]MBR3036445.1 hypothetical protein [Lachnospiraceae bacterium]